MRVYYTTNYSNIAKNANYPMTFTGTKDNGIITFKYNNHNYVVSITYGKIEFFRDEIKMKRNSKVTNYMLKRFYAVISE